MAIAPSKLGRLVVREWHSEATLFRALREKKLVGSWVSDEELREVLRRAHYEHLALPPGQREYNSPHERVRVFLAPIVTKKGRRWAVPLDSLELPDEEEPTWLSRWWTFWSVNALDSAIPWVRTAIAVPACVFAFNATHSAGQLLSPRAYDPLLLDSQRSVILFYVLLAGIVATFVVVALARHRALLHAVVLCAIGLAIDLRAIAGPLHDQPLWFRALVIALLPIQAAVGVLLGRMTWKFGARSTG